MMVIDRFLKMTHLILCQKTNDTIHVAELYSREIVFFHGILKIMTFDKDKKFVSHFKGRGGGPQRKRKAL